MSFNLLETSVFGGSPIELYEFSILGDTWRYTTDDRVTTFQGADFLPISELSRGSIRVTQNIDRTEVRVEMRGNVAIADQFRIAPPSEPVTLRIYKKHRGDPDYIIRWKGRVQGAVWEGPRVVLTCVPVHSTLKQPGLRRSYQYQCPYALYDTSCNVSRAAFEVLGTVTAISGTTITVTFTGTFDANYFAGGYVLWESTTGRQETRMVTASSGSSITLQNTTIGLSVGDAIRLYAGCDHLISTCHTKFNNAERFGGFPFIPETNPFAGTTIF